MTVTIAELAALLGCPPPDAQPGRTLTGIASLEEATDSDVTYLASDQYLKQFATTRAAVAIVQRKIKLPQPTPIPVIMVDDAELAIGKVLAKFAPMIPRPQCGIDVAARVADSARLAEDVAIGPFVYVGERCVIGRNTILHAGAYIGDDVTLGDHCEIFPNVVIRERITLGNRVIIHAGSVLGTDGFGYRWDGSKHAKIPQIGTVIIDDDVEIGSCTCIDRAKFNATRIGAGTKIDNLVQIAHNCEIGKHAILAGLTGLAGSAKVGNGAVLGGNVAVRDHVTIGDGAMVAATSGVAQDIAPKSIVSGTPAVPHRQSLREVTAVRHLPELIVQVRKLQKEIEAIQKRLGADSAGT